MSFGRDELRTMSEWGKLVTIDETKIQSAIKLIADFWSAQTYAVALTWGKDSLLCYSNLQRFLNVQNE